MKKRFVTTIVVVLLCLAAFVSAYWEETLLTLSGSDTLAIKDADAVEGSQQKYTSLSTLLAWIESNTSIVSFDSTTSARLANTSGTNTGDQDLSGKQDADDDLTTASGADSATNSTYFGKNSSGTVGFHAPDYAGISGVPAVVDDIGALVDPDADRIGFWDDSAGVFTWLTLGTNLSITDTTINANAGSGAPTDAYYVVTTADAGLSNEVVIGTAIEALSTLDLSGVNLTLDDDAVIEADVDDTPVDSATTDPISSNWAYDHAALTAAHGVSGAVVGTTDTQTLTNKTIDGDDNTLQDIGSSSMDLPPTILSSTQTLTDVHGNYIINGAYTITLSAVEPGDWGCFQVYGAYAASLAPNASDLLILDGTALSDGTAIVSDGTTGNSICFQYYDSTGWISWGNNGWASE